MNKAIKIIVLFLSLALVAGLFVFLLNLDLSGNKNLGESLELLDPEEQEENYLIILPEPSKEIEDEGVLISDLPTDRNNSLGPDELMEIIKEPKGGWNQENLAKQISKTVDLSTENNEVNLSYAQPDIPKDFHFTLNAEIFDEDGKAIDHYLSDVGWLSNDRNYDPSEKIETIRMHVENMNNRCAIISVKVGDSQMLNSTTIYQLTINYDGSKVWNTATWNSK